MSFKKLEKEINYSFKDSDLLKQSLTHKSFDDITNNENLEFLGDRVLGLIIAKKLIEIFPNEKEGIIDKKFANLVSKKTCSEIGRKMSLKKFMFLGNSYKKIKASDDKILGDCLEALIGAIYLDSNIEKTGNFILSFCVFFSGISTFFIHSNKLVKSLVFLRILIVSFFLLNDILTS